MFKRDASSSCVIAAVVLRYASQVVAADGDAVALGRPGVETVIDAHAVEIDIDFNVLHESAPLCTYGDELGLARYATVWSGEDVVGTPDIATTPSACDG